MPSFDFVVLGGGPAGAAAAHALATSDCRPSVMLVGDERHAPYERPPLSKAVLLEAVARERPAHLFGGAAGLQAVGVDCRFGDPAAGVDRVARQVTLASGEVIGYGALLWATGAMPRRLKLPGADLAGVHYLRTFDDALQLSEALRGGTLVVIGGGFIGLEVAAAAVQRGCAVTVIEAAPRLLGRAVPEVVSAAVMRKYAAHGVRVMLATGVEALVGKGHVNGPVQAVQLASGERLEAARVLVGIGAVANDALARAAGLVVDDGILVDDSGRTFDPHCFAAGDVARRPAGLAWCPGHRQRLEAWEPALEQGRAVAQAMLGRPVADLPLPWVWSNLFDWNIQMVGHGHLGDRCVVRAGRDPDALTLFQLRGDRLVGAVTLNEGRHMAVLRRQLAGCAAVDTALLADPAVPLRDALRQLP